MHQTHFTYVSSDVVSFTKVYRSGDTIVLERSVRADVEEPTTARRYYFDTEAAAIAWYTAWKNCAIKLAGDNNPIPVRRVTVDPRTIQVYNLELVLGSVRWPVSRMLFSTARWTIDRQNAWFTGDKVTSLGLASEINRVANSKQFHDSQCDHDMDLDAKRKPNHNINYHCFSAGLVPLF